MVENIYEAHVHTAIGDIEPSLIGECGVGAGGVVVDQILVSVSCNCQLDRGEQWNVIICLGEFTDMRGVKNQNTNTDFRPNFKWNVLLASWKIHEKLILVAVHVLK